MRKNALKCGLEGQRRTSFRRIELRLVRKAQNEPSTEAEGPKLTEIQSFVDIRDFGKIYFPKAIPLTTGPYDRISRHNTP